MAGESGLAAQLLALAKDVSKVEQQVKAEGERGEQLQAALDRIDLDPVQEAIDHLEDRTSGLLEQMESITPLRNALSALAGQVAQLRQDLTALAEEPGEEKLALWDWTMMNQQQAHEAWSILTNWVQVILAGRYGWVGYPADALAGNFGPPGAQGVPSRIPPCWYRHHEAVWELSWLCQEWIKLYTTSYGTPSKAGDWHDRYAPGVRRRLAVALEKCKDGHKTAEETLDRPAEGYDDQDALFAFIKEDLGYRQPAPAPGPVAASS
jgi:outer membrane murein-binding lipoprotein Lpp